MPDCPLCIGNLTHDLINDKWNIVLIVPNGTASGLDVDEFVIDVTLDDDSNYNEGLDAPDPELGSSHTTYAWTIEAPGSPVSGRLEMVHDPMGRLTQELEVAESGGRAA